MGCGPWHTEGMPELSPAARVVAALLALVSLAGYGAVVEAGWHAGVVHSGVRVAGLDLGGLTLEEAQAALNEHRSRLRDAPICFFSPEFRDCTTPGDLNWFPPFRSIAAMARRAYGVGRTGGPAEIVRMRLKAYTRGVDLRWRFPPGWRATTRQIDRWEIQLEALGYTLDRAKMRYKIKRAISTWPRRPLRFPVSAP